MKEAKTYLKAVLKERDFHKEDRSLSKFIKKERKEYETQKKENSVIFLKKSVLYIILFIIMSSFTAGYFIHIIKFEHLIFEKMHIEEVEIGSKTFKPSKDKRHETFKYLPINDKLQLTKYHHFLAPKIKGQQETGKYFYLAKTNQISFESNIADGAIFQDTFDIQFNRWTRIGSFYRDSIRIDFKIR